MTALLGNIFQLAIMILGWWFASSAQKAARAKAIADLLNQVTKDGQTLGGSIFTAMNAQGGGSFNDVPTRPVGGDNESA